MAEAEKEIESIGLVSCELNDECHFCENPQNGIYAQMVGYDSSDIAYYICGKCALDKIRSGVSHCREISKPSDEKSTGPSGKQ